MSIDHIGINVHPYLFESARFKIIKDELTGEWRTFRPWDENDARRLKDVEIDAQGNRRPVVRDAPPLIAPRFVKKIAWENRAKKIFSYVRHCIVRT